jgi:hypothetical protein
MATPVRREFLTTNNQQGTNDVEAADWSNKEKDRLLVSHRSVGSPSNGAQKVEQEPEVSKTMAAIAILIWGINNIAVTLVNKAAFASVDFKYPYVLSTVHIAMNLIGSQIYFSTVRSAKPKQIDSSYRGRIIAFSAIFTLNIAIGNMSLRWVSVNFNQVMRALIPAIVMVISMIFYGKTYSTQRKWAVVPIIIGVALAFLGDISTSMIGALYTMACIFMAALKAVASGELLTGDLKLHPIDLLSKMCPFALIMCLFIAILQGEVYELMSRWEEIVVSSAPLVVLISGFLSFGLNVSSFTANKYTSPLTLCIAANVKQVLLVLFGTMIFQDQVPFVNGLGIVIVLAASFRYGLIALSEK